MNIDELSFEWISAYTNERCKGKDLPWAVEYVMELTDKRKYDELWSFIKYTYQQDISQYVISVIAAGPLEDLISEAGEKYIDVIEELAKIDPKFNYLLGGVYQSGTSAVVWMRILTVRDEVW